MQTVILHGQSQRSFAKSLIDRAPNDAVVQVRPATRTNEQNALMWALLSEVSRAKPEGRHWTPETWKAAFLHLLGHHVRFCEGLDNSGPFPLGFSSSKLTIAQMSDLIECIREYGARHGIIFNDPETSRSDPAPPLAGSDVGGTPLSANSPADVSQQPAGETVSAPAGSSIPEKELTVLRRFAKDVLAMAAKPETSGELMTKVVNKWINIELANIQSDDGRGAVKSIHSSVKAIMKGDTSYEAAVSFHAEGLGVEPLDLMPEARSDG